MLLFTVVSIVALMLVTALTFNFGISAATTSALQSIADAAATDTAQYLTATVPGTYPDELSYLQYQAQVSEEHNGYSGTSPALAVQCGTEVGGTFENITSRSCPGATAVKVTPSENLNLLNFRSTYFARSAVAAVTADSGFSIGTYLASFSTQQSAILNGLLNEKLGTGISITAVGYAGLANTNVTIQQLISASGGLLTPTNVLDTSLTGKQWATILSQAVATQSGLLSCGGSTPPYPCTANTWLSTLKGQISASTSATLCQMVSVDGSSCSSTLSSSALSASINVLQTLTTEAELANGTNALNITSDLSLLDVSKVQLVTTLVQVPQVAYGPVGTYPTCPTCTTASTSQVVVDLQLTLSLLGAVGDVLNVPLTSASGTASLASISCANQVATANTIDASTSAVSTGITLLGAQIATVGVTGAPNTALTYTVIPPTTASATAQTNPQAIGTTSPTLTTGGYTGLVGALVGPLLSSILTPILSPVFQALGVSLAGAQVADLSSNCGSVSLVQ